MTASEHLLDGGTAFPGMTVAPVGDVGMTVAPVATGPGTGPDLLDGGTAPGTGPGMTVAPVATGPMTGPGMTPVHGKSCKISTKETVATGPGRHVAKDQNKRANVNDSE